MQFSINRLKIGNLLAALADSLPLLFLGSGLYKKPYLNMYTYIHFNVLYLFYIL